MLHDPSPGRDAGTVHSTHWQGASSLRPACAPGRVCETLQFPEAPPGAQRRHLRRQLQVRAPAQGPATLTRSVVNAGVGLRRPNMPVPGTQAEAFWRPRVQGPHLVGLTKVTVQGEQPEWDSCRGRGC